MSLEKEIEVKEVELTVEFEYTPGDPGKLTGEWENSWPPSDAEVDILSVRHHGVDIFELLSTDIVDRIVCDILEGATEEPDYE